MKRAELERIRAQAANIAISNAACPSLEIGSTKETLVLRNSSTVHVNAKSKLISGIPGGIAADGAMLPFRDHQFKLVATQFLLCSVDRPDLVAAEIGRVLTPGGHYIAVEHLPSTITALHLIQSIMEPISRRVFGTCRFATNHLAFLRIHAFELMEIKTFHDWAYPVALLHFRKSGMSSHTSLTTAAHPSWASS